MSARRLPRPRLTYANVMSTVAAFIALGGTSYAVAKLPKNSVGTPQLRAGAVTLDKLAAGVAISGPRGARGPEGPAGARGPSDVYYAPVPGNVVLDTPAFTDVAKLTLPAGSWALFASGSLVHEAAGASGDLYWRCHLVIGNDPPISQTVSNVGPTAVKAETFALHGAVTLTSPAPVRLRCAHDLAIAAGYPHVEGAELLALRTENLVIQ